MSLASTPVQVERQEGFVWRIQELLLFFRKTARLEEIPCHPDKVKCEASPTRRPIGIRSVSAGGDGRFNGLLRATLPVGTSYTVILRGADGGTGEALVEVYEVE